ncbi:hypothetical protein PoHVEF18_007821 [Penicillium ochrochloron]
MQFFGAAEDPACSSTFRDIVQELADKSQELWFLKISKRWIEQQIQEQLECEIPGSYLETLSSGDSIQFDRSLSLDEHIEFDETPEADQASDTAFPEHQNRQELKENTRNDASVPADDSLGLRQPPPTPGSLINSHFRTEPPHASGHLFGDHPHSHHSPTDSDNQVDPAKSQAHSDQEAAIEGSKSRRWKEKITEIYTDMLICRIMTASAKQGKKNKGHKQHRFSQAVLERFAALEKIDDEGARKWCHVTGKTWLAKYVKAAHLVPKCMSGLEIAMLSGDSKLILNVPRNATASVEDCMSTTEVSMLFEVERLKCMLMNPLNGLTMHKNIEVAYDSGHFAIVPTRQPIWEGIATEWKCLLVDEAQRSKIAHGDQGVATTQNTLHLMASAPDTEISAWLKAGVDDQSTECCEKANSIEVRCLVLHIASDIKAIHVGYQPSYGVFNGICDL